MAYERARLTDPYARRIEEATAALVAGDRKAAELIFRDILKTDPSHVAAVCGLAAISLTVSRGGDAVRLLRHALKQSAHLPLAWRGLCQAMVELGRLPEAEAAIRRLLKIEPENPKNWVLLGTVYTRLMRQADAVAAFEEAVRLNPSEVRLTLSIGHAHKTLGNRRESEEAYKACLRLDPNFSEAYWSLADLKNYVFSDAEMAEMRALQKDDGDDVDQAHLHFALGRALEQGKEYAAAFQHYAAGNVRRRKTVPFDIKVFENKTRRVAECFSAEFFAQRSKAGHSDRAPIFVVGLPRSGSTLIEQILASHSSVEGTFELPNVLTLVREFDHANSEHDAYPENGSRRAARATRESWPPLHGGDRSAAQRQAALHRQNAEQLQSRGPHSRHSARMPSSSTRAATRWTPASAPSSSTLRRVSPSAMTWMIWGATIGATSA